MANTLTTAAGHTRPPIAAAATKQGAVPPQPRLAARQAGSSGSSAEAAAARGCPVGEQVAGIEGVGAGEQLRLR